MVLLEQASRIFSGPIPSPYMLFTQQVHEEWRDRIPAVVHIDGSARIQTVDPADEPLVAHMLEGFARRTGVPVVVNTSLNTAGRPMVDDPRRAGVLRFGTGRCPRPRTLLGPQAPALMDASHMDATAYGC